MTVWDCQWALIGRLKLAGVSDPESDARAILGFVLDLNPVQLLANRLNKLELSHRQKKKLDQLIRRRENREPIDYILGFSWFAGRQFLIQRGVLIPRPETEFLIESARDIIGSSPPNLIVEFGVGSGILGITLGHLFPKIPVLGWEKSQRAYRCAHQNLLRYPSPNIRFFHGDFFKAPHRWRRTHKNRILLIGNPPYIRTSSIPHLQPEIANYEPKMALNGGKDGLKIYQKLIGFLDGCQASCPLELVLEIGFDQGEPMKHRLISAGFSVKMINDFSDLPRVVVAARNDVS